MADIIKPDLCVIGAGALGTSLAIRARQAGLDTMLIRRSADAANDPASAILRRAAFMASARRAQLLRTAASLGLTNAEPKPNFRTIAERAAYVAELAAPQDSDDRLAALGITVLSDDAAFLDKQTLRCGDARIRARQFALATGAVPLIPALPGLDQVAFFTPNSIADNIRKLSHLLVIGATPVAFELAQAYRRLGSAVTLVPQGALLAGFDPELVAILLRDLRDEGVTILDDAEVTAILPRSQGTGIAITRAGSEESLDVSHILLAMGDLPDLDAGLLDLTRLKREHLRPDHLLLGPDGQSSSGRITALGGAAGISDPQIAQRQAVLLVERLLGHGAGRLEPLAVPRLVMTEPALAQLGLLETGKALRPGQTVLRSNLAENHATRADGLSRGAAKVIVDAKGTVSAAGAVGAGAGEVIGTLALALSRGLGIGDLASLALPQPSAAQALVDLADQFLANQKPAGWRNRLPMVSKNSR